MRLEKRKGKFAEEKFTSALLTFFFHPSNRIRIIPCFISKGWVREHLPILIQANAEREMAASNRNDPLDKSSSSLISHSRSVCVGSGSLRCGKKECVKEKKMDISSVLLQNVWTPTFSLKLQSQWLYEETEPTCRRLAKCNMSASGRKPECACLCEFVRVLACATLSTELLSTKIIIVPAKWGHFYQMASFWLAPTKASFKVGFRTAVRVRLASSLGVGHCLISPQR